MKKTWWAIIFIVITQLVIFSVQSKIPGEIWLEGHWKSPNNPDQGESVDVYCSVGHTGNPSYIIADLYYRINGNPQNPSPVSMSNMGGGTYKATIPPGSLGDFIEYRIRVEGEVDSFWYLLYSPSSTGWHSYTVAETSDISWISPSDGTEIPFGPIDNNIIFDFNWNYNNLDDATLRIGNQNFDILGPGGKVLQVVLDGASFDGSPLTATLNGYKNGILVDFDVRYFSFRRLDYGLNWDSPSDGNTISFSPTGLARFNFTFSKGFDIQTVKMFFNTTDMGEVTNPGMVEFTFEDFSGSVFATLRGYDSYNNEVASDTRTFVFRRLIVEVVWESPGINSSITFDPGTDPVEFNLTYSMGTDVEYVKLELNAIDMGVVSSPGTVAFLFNDSFYGLIEAILRGYNEFDTEISSDTRHFTFDKKVATRFEILQQDEIDQGRKLYLILHDPNGDGSTSSYEKSTTISLGIGCEITAGVTQGLEVGVEEKFDFFGLFETGIEASTKLSLSLEASLGFDARFDISDSTFLSSSDSSTSVDHIGPGYGDRYWGELWKFRYVITSHYVEYYNGTEVYYDPHLWWGILRDSEAYLSDANAPQNWRELNPAHQNYTNEQVEWISGFLVTDGAGTYINSHEVTNTNTVSASIIIGIKSETKSKLTLGGVHVEETLELSLKTKVYAEASVGNSIKTSYTIHDDDPEDSIVQRVGIDKNFGTYIFQTEPNFCATSSPIEHNTVDYVPPKLGYPTIIYDTDQDFKGPTPHDSPLVTVKIEEEGGVQDAVLYFSNDNGTSWRSTPLLEYQGQPDIWHANIPKQANMTTILWYLKAWDERGNTAEKYDITGSYFSYEVGVLINPLSSTTPGFTIWTIMFGMVIGVFLVLKRKPK